MWQAYFIMSNKCHLRKRGKFMGSDYFIRNVQEQDIQSLIEIYAYYVEKTAVTFEYFKPSYEEFKRRVDTISSQFPYLVCEVDGKVVGYVYANSYNTREAYNWTVTTSIYIDKNYRKAGIGSALYEALEENLKKQGIENLLASVAYLEKADEYITQDSYYFHLRKGYSKVAHMVAVGKKFDRWYDIVWMQKKI